MHPTLALLAPLLAPTADPVAAPADDGGGQWQLSLYAGAAHTPRADVRLQEPNGTDLTLRDVRWEDASFEAPPYWGARVTYWTQRAPNWGVALDFVHPKMIADQNESRPSSGTIGGAPAGPTTPVGDVFDRLEFTDGHNLITLNGLYRWNPGAGTHQPWYERWQPYVGVGAGVAVPHADVTTANGKTYDYLVAGPAFNALGGVSLPLSDHFATFAEYRLSYADMSVDLDGGGRLEVEPLTHMVSFGLTYTF